MHFHCLMTINQLIGDSPQARADRAFTRLAPIAYGVVEELSRDNVYDPIQQAESAGRDNSVAWDIAHQQLVLIAQRAQPILEERILEAGKLVADVYKEKTTFRDAVRSGVDVRRQAVRAIDAVGGQTAVDRVARYNAFEVAANADMHVSYVRGLTKLLREDHHE